MISIILTQIPAQSIPEMANLWHACQRWHS